jgi:hypothetical protein
VKKAVTPVADDAVTNLAEYAKQNETRFAAMENLIKTQLRR